MVPTLVALVLLSVASAGALAHPARRDASLVPGGVDVSIARSCISRTWPQLGRALTYPDDVQTHFEQIHAAIATHFGWDDSFTWEFGDAQHQGSPEGEVVCWSQSGCAPSYEML